MWNLTQILLFHTVGLASWIGAGVINLKGDFEKVSGETFCPRSASDSSCHCIALSNDFVQQGDLLCGLSSWQLVYPYPLSPTPRHSIDHRYLPDSVLLCSYTHSLEPLRIPSSLPDHQKAAPSLSPSSSATDHVSLLQAH